MSNGLIVPDDADRRYHKLAFCTAGGWGHSTPTLLEGCGVSCPSQVVSRVARIDWSTQPEVVRSSRAPEDSQLAGERLTSIPAIPSIQMLDADGRPLSGRHGGEDGPAGGVAFEKVVPDNWATGDHSKVGCDAYNACQIHLQRPDPWAVNSFVDRFQLCSE